MKKISKEEIEEIAMSVTLEMCLEDRYGETLVHNDILISDSGNEYRLIYDFENLCMLVELHQPNGKTIYQSVDRESLEKYYRKKIL